MLSNGADCKATPHVLAIHEPEGHLALCLVLVALCKRASSISIGNVCHVQGENV